MDDCPRQDPAYRPAKEEPRFGGAFLWLDKQTDTRADPGLMGQAGLHALLTFRQREKLPARSRARTQRGRVADFQVSLRL